MHHIPFKPRANGRLQLPDLQLQYFDPQSAKINNITQHAPRALVLNLPWRITIAALVSVLLLWIGRKILSRLKKTTMRMRHRRLAFTELAKAQSVFDIRASLNLIAKAEGWQGNMTLQQWQRRYEKLDQKRWPFAYPESARMTTLVQQLSEACYRSDSEMDVKKYRASLIAALKSKDNRKSISDFFHITRRECQ